jgi:hypothetical protein
MFTCGTPSVLRARLSSCRFDDPGAMIKRFVLLPYSASRI